MAAPVSTPANRTATTQHSDELVGVSRRGRIGVRLAPTSASGTHGTCVVVRVSQSRINSAGASPDELGVRKSEHRRTACGDGPTDAGDGRGVCWTWYRRSAQ